MPSNQMERIRHNHCARDFGATGVRKVELRVLTPRSDEYVYMIYHAWWRQGQVCRSIFYLVEPPAMAGTGLLLEERANEEDMTIFLRLRSARLALAVHPSRCVQSVLGTDFTYEDLRFWLPLHTISQCEVVTGLDRGRSAFLIRGNLETPYRRAASLRLALDAEGWLPMSIDWYDAPIKRLARVYRVKSLQKIGGVLTPTAVRVFRPPERYMSTMILHRERHGVAMDATLYDPRAMCELNADVFRRHLAGTPS
jgi:hypothetical protein